MIIILVREMNRMKKTKIVATLGPSCDNKDVLREMVKKGLNVFRINMSHATMDEVDLRVTYARELSSELNTHIGVLFDTKGPEIRSGSFENGSITLTKGDMVTVTSKDVIGNEKLIPIQYKTLYSDVEIGYNILLNNGLMKLTVVEKTEEDLICRVEVDGTLKNKRMVNLPGVIYSMPYLSEADKNDIITAIKYDADFIALSFVSCKEDVLAIKKILKEYNNTHIQLICKIENERGVENIDEILEVSDGIMVARGDLGVELPIERLPIVQKELIKKCREQGKICITATEMLASMEKSLRPTRAEVSDVANAVFDGTDAIMLSGETSVGDFPIETIEVMSKIAETAEEQLSSFEFNYENKTNVEKDVTQTIAYAVIETAHILNAKAITTATTTGYTAKKISNHRPECPIIALTTNEYVARSLVLNYGVYPIITEEINDIDEIIESSVSVTNEKLSLNPNDKIIVVGGFPLTGTNMTNFMKIEEIK
jgi:pyruvate kinase